MRAFIGFSAAFIAIAGASAAASAPGVEFRDAAARVTVIPEARSDVLVEVVRANPRLPLTISHAGDQVSVDGGLRMRPQGCHSVLGKPAVFIFGVGDFGVDALPQVVVHTPMDARVGAGELVFGRVERANSVELRNSGCGDWTVGPVAGDLAVSVSGSGDVRAEESGSAKVRISGSGDVGLGAVRGGLSAAISGSGDVKAASINGPLEARISGSGDVTVRGGQATSMKAQIAGSGDVTMKGPAQSLDASIAGSGDVTVGRVTGAVVKHVSGSGDVNIGR